MPYPAETPVTDPDGLRCTAVWDGVRCHRTATEFYSVEDPPYYEGHCPLCDKRSRPRGREDAGSRKISEEEAVIRSVMEESSRAGSRT